jgi:hypothetical protein
MKDQSAIFRPQAHGGIRRFGAGQATDFDGDSHGSGCMGPWNPKIKQTRLKRLQA